jgi:hypothetical protein
MVRFDMYIYKGFVFRVSTPPDGPSSASILSGPVALPDMVAPDVGTAYGAMAERIEQYYRESGPPIEGR